MIDSKAKLYIIVGKIAAGKSTLAAQLSARPDTILISEDEWMNSLYPGEIKTLEDYVRCTGRFRQVIGNHIVSLLRSGLSVVLDFQANTLKSREWMRDLFERADVEHELHYLDVPDEICKARLKKRNASGEHPYQTSEQEFELFSKYFVVPSEAEGFQIIRHS